MDFYRLRRDRQDLERFLSERLAARPDLRFVDVRDRFGTRVALVPANAMTMEAGTLDAKVPLMLGGIPQGEVRVGVSTEAIDLDIETLRRSLRIKVALVAALGVGLLAVGLFYSLHLIRKNRALEHARQSSERVAYRVNLGSGLAHEIRNPLGSIRLGVSMLRDSVSDEDALNTIELVERGIKHLNKLVVDVTQFSRQKALERTRVDLRDSLERSIDLVSERIREKNATVDRKFSDASIVGQWDADQLRQVFVNVIANAVDASPENAIVKISTQTLSVDTDGDAAASKTYARVIIEDRGKGMDEATRDRIFEPFFSTKKRGTGLGLAIVKQIVEHHGGRISVASEPGSGSRFTIDLPISQ